MANRIISNVYIIDSAQTLTGLAWAPSADADRKVNSVVFYSTDTTGELKLVFTSNTTNTFIHIRNNQSQPFSLPYFLGGVWVGQLTPIICTAGTGFIYFA